MQTVAYFQVQVKCLKSVHLLHFFQLYSMLQNFLKTMIFKMLSGIGLKSNYIIICINVCNFNRSKTIEQCSGKTLLVIF